MRFHVKLPHIILSSVYGLPLFLFLGVAFLLFFWSYFSKMWKLGTNNNKKKKKHRELGTKNETE